MERIVIYLFLLNACFDINIALKRKHIMDKLDYIEERLNAESTRLNAESKFRKEGFNILLDKVVGMELMLNKLLEKKESERSSSEISDKTMSDISSNKMMTILLKSFEAEKFENKRFKREILQDVNKQVESMKEANERLENSLEFLTKEIGQIKQQTLQHDIDADKSAGQVIQILEENARNTMSLLNSTLQNTINKQAGQMSEAYDRVEKSLGYMRKKIEQIKDEARHHHIDSDKVAKNETVLLNSTMQKTETILIELNDTSELIKEQVHLYETLQAQIETGRLSCLNQTFGLTEKLNVILKLQRRPESCFDLYLYGFHSDGIYKIQIGPAKTDISVYCDMTTDGGGWTVFQRRQDGSEDFYRDWNDYKYGFGKLDGEFWLGNEYINLLTDDYKIHELRIDLEDYEGDRAYAKYNKFKIGPESTNYTLEVSGYTGNAGDSLNVQDSWWGNHNGMQFSTKDRDNDLKSSNCASANKGAWWFNHCFSSHLNAVYNKQNKCTDIYGCIVWEQWKDSYYHNMKFTEMKFR